MAEKLTDVSVTVVMVNYNCTVFIDGVMNSLRRQTFRGFDVIVYDNGSTDGSVEYIRANYPECRVVELGWNTGFAHPNNLGIKESKTKYVLALNMDVVLEDDFLEKLVDAISSRPGVGWVAPGMNRLMGGNKTDLIDRYGHHMQKNRKTGHDSSKPVRPAAYDRREEVFGASGCAALYKREMLEDIAFEGEYFDEDFFAYYEDIDLDWRAQRAGWKCLLVPDALGYHAGGGSGLRKERSIAACELTNRLFMLIKDEFAAHFLQDIVPIARTTRSDWVRFYRMDHGIIYTALRRFFRLLPRMLAKRSYIRKNTRVSADYIRGLIRHPG